MDGTELILLVARAARNKLGEYADPVAVEVVTDVLEAVADELAKEVEFNTTNEDGDDLLRAALSRRAFDVLKSGDHRKAVIAADQEDERYGFDPAFVLVAKSDREFKRWAADLNSLATRSVVDDHDGGEVDPYP